MHVANLDTLSDASRTSLKYQGGPFNADEVAAFEKDPFHQDKVRLRRWDDLAKREDYQAPELETYRPLAVSQLRLGRK
jgi:predicted HD phosphohydrolase